MDRLMIEGPCKIQGEVLISGAKNAVLPILAATLMTSSIVTLDNIPHLHDVTTMIDLLGRLGVGFTLCDKQTLLVDAATVSSSCAPYELVKTMRASILVLGPLLARYGHAEVSMPGGCAIGSRPVDVHIEGMRALGAKVTVTDGFICAKSQGRLKGAEVNLGKITVTGTENILMASVLADGITTIYNAACEPEVSDLANFLVKAGAKIKGIGTETLVIEGVEHLHAVEYSIMPDRIEAGTYLVAAAMTRGNILLKNVWPQTMGVILDTLRLTGAVIETTDRTISLDMKNKRPLAVSICTAPYPKMPTDMQAQFLALNTVAQGPSEVRETVFENRFMHVPELSRMGAKIKLKGNLAMVCGIEALKPAPVMATDLRASAGLVLAGLVAQGKTEISRIYHVDRGYECIEEKFTQLGAKIYRVSNRVHEQALQE